MLGSVSAGSENAHFFLAYHRHRIGRPTRCGIAWTAAGKLMRTCGERAPNDLLDKAVPLVQHAQGRLQVLCSFTATGGMQHDRLPTLPTRGTLHGVVVSTVNMFMPPNASVRVNPECACSVLPTAGRNAAQSF